MRKEEAKYIGELVKRLTITTGGPVLNLGSSSGYFRKVDQSHIHEEIFAPLESAKVKVIHSDLKDQDGVDISGDIFDPEMQRRLKKLRPRIVLVCNLMEHLQGEVRNQLPEALDHIVEPGGYLIISVPYSYPLHFDPIDTNYRPSPEELHLLFPSYGVVDARVVMSSTFLPELLQLHWRTKLKYLARALTPFYHPRNWLGLMHRFTFLFRPYKVSCVVLQRSYKNK